MEEEIADGEGRSPVSGLELVGGGSECGQEVMVGLPAPSTSEPVAFLAAAASASMSFTREAIRAFR